MSIPFTSGNSFLPSPLFFVEFMQVSSPNFRGIYQTILKTAVFSVTSTFLSIFIKGQTTRGTHFYKFWSFLPVQASSFQSHGFVSAIQYDRRSTLLTPYGFYSGDLLSLPQCIQQTHVQCMLVVRVFPPIRITLPLSSRKCRPRPMPRLSHPAIRATARLTQNPELRQCSVPLLPTGI